MDPNGMIVSFCITFCIFQSSSTDNWGKMDLYDIFMSKINVILFW